MEARKSSICSSLEDCLISFSREKSFPRHLRATFVSAAVKLLVSGELNILHSPLSV